MPRAAISEMISATVRPCPVCAGNNAQRLHFQKYTAVEGHPLKEGYWVVCCEQCGMVFADVAVTQVDMDRFYAERSKYSDAHTATGVGQSPIDSARLERLADRIAEHLPDRDARIADIGCAGGGLLRALEHRGYRNVLGIDPSPACVALAQHPNLRAFVGKLDQLPREVHDVDCAVLSHVCEHVIDVSRSMASLHSILRPLGCVLVEVPDASSYGRHLVAPFQEFNTEHINHFSSRSLANLFVRNGYSVVSEYDEELAGSAAPYPVIGGIYQKSAGSPLVYDTKLKVQIEAYIAASAKLMNALNERILHHLRRHPRIVVWGMGQLAMKLLSETALADADIAAFVDGSAVNWGRKIRNIPILSPEEAATYAEPILITTTLHEKAITADIRQKLRMSNELLYLSTNED